MPQTARPLVDVALPDFAAELRRALQDDGRHDLADQVGALAAFGRCSCDVDSCASFYTDVRPGGPWADLGDYYCVPVTVSTGMVVVDVVDGRIRHVEVLDRPDVEHVVATWPPAPAPDQPANDSASGPDGPFVAGT